jgi:hypothetical protein
MDKQSVLPYRRWKRLSDSSTEEASVSKTGRSGRDAHGHVTTRGYRRAYWHLVTSRPPLLEEKRVSSLLRGLQKTE